MNLSIKLFGIEFKNPVWVASGTFGYGLEALELYDVSKLGAIVTKGLSLRPRQGNEPNRIAETPCGMLNSIGLQNPGVEEFLKKIYPKIEKLNTHFIANVFGETEEEYLEVCMALEGANKIVAYELNVSCPNVKKGGLAFGHDLKVLGNLVSRIKGKVKKPVLVKLSPNTGEVVPFGRVCVENGADGLVAINTIVGMKIDIRTKKPVLSTVKGGLSGPAILPIAVRMVWELYQALGEEIPIIGVGGIFDTNSALEHILAGASAIQVGTANFFDPLSPLGIIEGISQYMKEQGIERFEQLVGLAHHGQQADRCPC
ncbi:dihydroorotate dehydrogenase [Thermocrinis jamiesonii]|uniref:dihydroorotate dehydrogenase n=1 Tax=Thermocrinis jamiesonii TaxID=1302351 RepID=UPI0004977F23|nr:dihydroorotate dehydrogenase [Thermocrinis jamiesonii]